MVSILPPPFSHRYNNIHNTKNFKDFNTQSELHKCSDYIQFTQATMDFIRRNKSFVYTLGLRTFVIDVLISNYKLVETVSFIGSPKRAEEWIYLGYAYFRMNNASALTDLCTSFNEHFNGNKKEQIIFIRETLILLIGSVKRTFGIEISSQLDFFEKKLEIENTTANVPLYKLLAYLLTAFALFYRGEINRCESFTLKLKDIAEFQEDQYILASLENIMGILKMKKGEYDNALDLLGIAAIYTEETGVLQNYGMILNNRAAIFSSLGKYDEALELLEKLYTSLKIEDNPLQYLIATVNLGEILTYQNRFKEAEKIVIEAIEVLEKFAFDIAEPYLNMANIQIMKNKEKDAKQYLDKADEVVQKTNDINASLFYDFIVSNYYIKFEDNDELAIIHLKNCLEKAIQTFNYEYVIKSQLFLVDIYLSRFSDDLGMNSYSNIIYYAENVINIAKEQNLPHIETDILLMKGRLELTFGVKDEARKSIERAYTIATNNYYMELRSRAEDLLYELNHQSDIISQAKLEAKNMTQESIHEKYLSFKFLKEAKEIKNKLYGVILLDSGTGIPYYEYYSNEGETKDAVLLTSALSALQMYTNSVFNGMQLKRVKHEEYMFLMDQLSEKDNIILICDRENFKLRLNLSQFKEDLKNSKKVVDNIKAFKKDTDRVMEELILKNFQENLSIQE